MLGLTKYLLGGSLLVSAALGIWLYIERANVKAADARATVAERDMKQWHDNFDEADRVGKANAAALAEYKAKAAESAVAADAAHAIAEANAKKYTDLLAKVREQHAPSDTSPLLRAYLDGLCREATAAACRDY